MVDQVRTSSNRTTAAGADTPLGATPTAAGVNFAVYSQHASEVFLLLYSAADEQPTDVIALAGPTNGVWHIHVDGVAPGQLYGYRVGRTVRPGDRAAVQQRQGRSRPVRQSGHRKVPQHRQPSARIRPAARSRRADAGCPRFGTCRAESDRRRRHRLRLAGRCTPGIGPRGADHLRGAHQRLYRTSILGRANPRARTWASSRRSRICRRWGSTPSSCCRCTSTTSTTSCCNSGPHQLLGLQLDRLLRPRVVLWHGSVRPVARSTSSRRLSASCTRRASRCILDVVFNHTGEGNEMGPTISFRGIDNPSYYMSHRPAGPTQPLLHDFSGCGNTLDFDSPAVIRLVTDSLRYWVQHMHVDGFRFDLASVLGRTGQGEGFRPTLRFSTRCSRIRCWAD